jgi:hypothetical protein
MGCRDHRLLDRLAGEAYCTILLRLAKQRSKVRADISGVIPRTFAFHSLRGAPGCFTWPASPWRRRIARYWREF